MPSGCKALSLFPSYTKAFTDTTSACSQHNTLDQIPLGAKCSSRGFTGTQTTQKSQVLSGHLGQGSRHLMVTKGSSTAACSTRQGLVWPQGLRKSWPGERPWRRQSRGWRTRNMSPHSLLLSRPEAALQQLLASSSLWSHSFCLQVQRLPQLPVPTTCLREPNRTCLTERQRPRDCHIHVQQGWWISTLSVSRPRTEHLGCDTGLTVTPRDNGAAF